MSASAAPNRFDGSGLHDYIQDVLTKLLQLRPENPIEFMAEYFRTASALDSLPASTVASSSTPFTLHTPTLTPQPSTPLSRAVFLIRATQARQRPEEFAAQLERAFEELSTSQNNQQDGGLLGSLLLTKPTKGVKTLNQSRSKSALFAGQQSPSSDDPHSTTSPTTATIDAVEFKSLLHRLLLARPTSNQAVRRYVPLPPDLVLSILAGFNEEALAVPPETNRDQHSGVPSTARPAQPTLPTGINFASFDNGVRDVLQLRELYEKLCLLLLSLQPMVAKAADDRLKQLQIEQISHGECIELLRILVSESTATGSQHTRDKNQKLAALLKAAQRSNSASNSNAGPPLKHAQIKSILLAIDIHPSGNSFVSNRTVPLFHLIRAILLAVAEEKTLQRRQRRAQLLKEAERLSAEAASTFGSSAATSSATSTKQADGGLDPHIRDIYAAALSINPARVGILYQFEEPETIEYS